MPRKLSEEYVDSDDDHSFSPPAEERETRSKKPIKQAASSSKHKASESDSSDSSSEDEPLKKKVKTDATKGKSKATSEKKGKDEKEKKPIKKDRSESPQTKRKVGAAAKYGSGPEVHTDDSGDKYIELAANRRATVRAFKGKTYVDIRETYEQDGKTKPGKKGIMLSIEQWDRLKKAVSTLDDAVDDLA
ncbi:hypothetical protein C6P46_003236 [Rhodotorula mucilaginosa]|uniref:Transcriptional coactivator p15 (PC4) C-terminal domain-containing protein n=1 Tax=Rhodotorula mucilaginosa TaxID=5537 RepID=A0A9P6W4L1_RHOMI|nr:hypothetical protein C6P46_003236 [Rhodotorula mucilaginosa]